VAETLREQRAALDAAHRAARDRGIPVRRGSGDDRTELMGIDGGRVLVYGAENADAAISTAADRVRGMPPYHADGAGVTIGLWDMGGANSYHRELAGRAAILDDASISDHPTHVAGTLIASGVTLKARGMAPAGRVDCYNWTLDISEMTQRARAATAETNTLCLSNHSYGHLAGWYYNSSGGKWEWYGTWGSRESDMFGLYDPTAVAWDRLCYEAPYFLPFKSAGNDRLDGRPGTGTPFDYFDGTNWVSKPFDPAVDPRADNADQGGYDTLPDLANAKNIVTVGAVEDAVNGTARSLARANMTPFSCWGPSDDGRVKPDIVANGTELYSCVSRTAAAYGEKSGTSMSAPNAAGSAALLVDYYRDLSGGSYMLSSSLKGLIIHTADDLGNNGPDYKFGWGLMNTERAASFLQEHFDFPNAGRLREANLATNVLAREHKLMWDGRNPIRVTLCWTDPPAEAQSDLDDRASRLVNNLDLRVVDPRGTTNYPYVLDPLQPANAATRGDNSRDNVEQVWLAEPPTGGIYTVTVSFDGTALTNGVQPYSLLVSGFTAPPAIRYEPLDNQTITNGWYDIEAEIVAMDGLDSNALFVAWNTTGSTGAFQSNALVCVSNDTYAGQIPAQPVGSTVYYYLSARSSVGLLTRNPIGAPADVFSFDVTEPVVLTVYGSPENIGTVVPGYGQNVVPRGSTVRASAIEATAPRNGHRYECYGWTGHADVPAAGDSNSVSFKITRDSLLLWRWDGQFSLSQAYSGVALAGTGTWWSVGAPASTFVAPQEVTEKGTVFRFAEWRVDGSRWGDTNGISTYQAEGIAMTTARTAEAHYYTADRDQDGDDLADWWEVFYAGSLSLKWYDDTDGDGYLNLEEYVDRANPKDGGSIPGGPSILHVPLDSPQAHPAPWTVTAVVTDNFAVASATLRWRRNGLGWRQTAMTTTGKAGEYSAEIAFPGIKGDSYEYRIEASDAAGYTSEVGPFSFFVAYPLISLTPTNRNLTMLTETSANILFNVRNTGNTSLVWHTSLSGVGFRDNVESGEGDWSHDGPNDLWHLSTRRAFSGSNSWFCGEEQAGLYHNSMNASLVTPMIPLAGGARLEYMQWIKTERRNDTETWDAGVVEVSLDGGLNYELIEPVGGYPYVIVDNPASPIAFGSPCFGGTGGWERVVFDLSDFEGLAVKVRFRFGSDEFVVDEGWYIDDVCIGPSQTLSQWLTLGATNGTLVAGGGTNVGAVVRTDGLPTRTDDALLVGFHSNDPLQPSVFAEVALHVRSAPAVTVSFAGQTSTNGEGIVTIGNLVSDADGDGVGLALDCSSDGGQTWTPVWIASADADMGFPGIATSPPVQVTGIQTWDVTNAVTNCVAAQWATTNESAAIVCQSNVLVRAQAWDGVFWGASVTSLPFVVDNEGPPAPLLVTVTSHTPRTWSPLAVVAGAWQPGGGEALRGYMCAVTSATTAAAGVSSLATGTTGSATTEIDGTNLWFSVRGVDLYGNQGETESAGPLYIDVTPPSATGAVVSIAHDPHGNFLFSSVVTSSWSGFVDAGSGIAGYYVSLSDGAGTTNGLWTAASAAVLAGGKADATNTVYVWARDVVGRIGDAAAASVVILRRDGDFDGDGLLTWKESVSGTDPTDGNSVFALVGCVPNVSGYQETVSTNEQTYGDFPGGRIGDVVTTRVGVVSGTVISWKSVTGRYYAVYAEPACGGEGVIVATNLPATPPLNVYTDRVDTAGRFYRIGVAKP